MSMISNLAIYQNVIILRMSMANSRAIITTLHIHHIKKIKVVKKTFVRTEFGSLGDANFVCADLIAIARTWGEATRRKLFFQFSAGSTIVPLKVPGADDEDDEYLEEESTAFGGENKIRQRNKKRKHNNNLNSPDLEAVTWPTRKDVL